MVEKTILGELPPNSCSYIEKYLFLEKKWQILLLRAFIVVVIDEAKSIMRKAFVRLYPWEIIPEC